MTALSLTSSGSCFAPPAYSRSGPGSHTTTRIWSLTTLDGEGTSTERRCRASPDDRSPDGQNVGQVKRHGVPAVSLVAAREHCSRTSAEIEPGRIAVVSRHRVAHDCGLESILRQTLFQRLPCLAGVVGPEHAAAGLRRRPVEIAQQWENEHAARAV